MSIWAIRVLFFLLIAYGLGAQSVSQATLAKNREEIKAEKQRELCRWCDKQQEASDHFQYVPNFNKAAIGFLVEEAFRLEQKRLIGLRAKPEILLRNKMAFKALFEEVMAMLALGNPGGDIISRLSQMKIFLPGGQVLTDYNKLENTPIVQLLELCDDFDDDVSFVPGE